MTNEVYFILFKIPVDKFEFLVDGIAEESLEEFFAADHSFEDYTMVIDGGFDIIVVAGQL